jgi:holo-[acyl-carrier protein] synthase
MAILGIGIDIVELERIERIHARHGEAFIRRFCRPGEWQPRRGAALVEHLGGLFAAKEATMKALGTGWAQGISFRHIEVVRATSGAPTVRLHDAAQERSKSLGADSVHLSITHERRHAAAVAILEGPPAVLEGPPPIDQDREDDV